MEILTVMESLFRYLGGKSICINILISSLRERQLLLGWSRVRIYILVIEEAIKTPR